MKPAHVISPPDWMRQPDLIRLLDVLNYDGVNARMVGGCIRNSYMDRDVKDVDIACKFPPEMTVEILNGHGIRTIPTGIDHGTITAHINGVNFEITTLRRDVETDGRHANVEFSQDWVEDAKRRDFTINALYADRDGSVYDPLGTGLIDIENRVVRFIGDAQERINEDYLRILRFFRFSCSYGEGDPHKASFYACCALSGKIETLSDERITDELFKLLADDGAHRAVSWMNDCGLFGIPPSASAKIKTLIGLQNQLKCVDARGRYFASKIDRKYIKNNRIKSFFNDLNEVKNEWDGNVKKALYHFDRDVVVQGILILISDGHDIADHIIADALTIKTPELPVIAQDVMRQFKLNEGPEVGVKLRQAESIWIDSDFKLSRNEILEKLV